ncbi:unnamed protein product [Agarophyton chilense]
MPARAIFCLLTSPDATSAEIRKEAHASPTYATRESYGGHRARGLALRGLAGWGNYTKLVNNSYCLDHGISGIRERYKQWDFYQD